MFEQFFFGTKRLREGVLVVFGVQIYGYEGLRPQVTTAWRQWAHQLAPTALMARIRMALTVSLPSFPRVVDENHRICIQGLPLYLYKKGHGRP